MYKFISYSLLALLAVSCNAPRDGSMHQMDGPSGSRAKGLDLETERPPAGSKVEIHFMTDRVIAYKGRLAFLDEDWVGLRTGGQLYLFPTSSVVYVKTTK